MVTQPNPGSGNSGSGSTNTGPTSSNTSSTGSTKPASSSTSNTSSTPATPQTTSDATIKGDSTTKPAVVAKQDATIRTSHAGVVTSSISALLVVLGVAYWIFIRQRPEVAPVKAYKLNTGKKTAAKAKAVAKKA